MRRSVVSCVIQRRQAPYSYWTVQEARWGSPTTRPTLRLERTSDYVHCGLLFPRAHRLRLTAPFGSDFGSPRISQMRPCAAAFPTRQFADARHFGAVDGLESNRPAARRPTTPHSRFERALAMRHARSRTLTVSLAWIPQHNSLLGRRHPCAVGEPQVRQFLEHVAVNGPVRASTQNHALCTPRFVDQEMLSYRHVNTTMICTHALNPGLLGLQSPAHSWPRLGSICGTVNEPANQSIM